MTAQQGSGFRIDWGLFLYAVNMTLATLAALAISFWSNLPEPYWSVITVAVLANPNTDQVTVKSFARIAGTLLGALYAVLLVALFVESRLLFLGALCLWQGVCVWLGSWFRDSESYAFALSGYTATIIAIPAGLEPSSTFDVATGRVSEVFVGIAVTWVFSAIIFPKHSYLDLPTKTRTAMTILVQCLSAGAEGASARVKLATLLTTLHSDGRRIELSDPEARQHIAAIRSIYMAIMRALFLSSALSSPDRRRMEPKDLASSLSDALSSTAAAGQAQTQWDEVAQRLEEEVLAAPRHSRDIDTAVLWLRLAEQCRKLLLGYRAYYDRGIAPIRITGRFHLADSDGLLASIAALQAMTSFAIVAAFWIATGWESGVGALIIASVYTLRLYSKLHAIGAYRMMAWVVTISTVPALALSFHAIPMLDSYPTLALAISPYLIAAYMVGGLGGPFGPMAILIVLILAIALQPENVTTYELAASLNGILATMLSFLACAAVSQILLPTAPWLLRLRLLRAAARTLRRAAGNSLDEAYKAETRLTFLASEIAPEFHSEKDPFRETEAAFMTGLAAIALARLHDNVRHGDTWAQTLQELRHKTNRLSLLHWRTDLKSLMDLAARGGQEARSRISADGDGRACQAATSFGVFQQAIRTLFSISLFPDAPGPERPRTRSTTDTSSESAPTAPINK